jgi:hypothetical protein
MKSLSALTLLLLLSACAATETYVNAEAVCSIEPLYLYEDELGSMVTVVPEVVLRIDTHNAQLRGACYVP